MCGITGFFSRSLSDREFSIESMCAAISHRGPDDRGFWLDPNGGLALGHLRLAILDLSPEGHQPMRSQSGRYVIVFNGEVFNFKELIVELGSVRFRGHSDTEVMLACFEAWGVEASVRKFVGMFAFAVWDTSERVLHLVRDRMGIKPLYYGWSENNFIFGSELRALRAFPGFNNSINRDAIVLLMRGGYIPAPHSIFKDIYKLEAGSILTFKYSQLENRPEHFSEFSDQGGEGSPKKFWSLVKVTEQGISKPFMGSPEDAVLELEQRLKDCIRLRMISDVPLGAFLSGGVDSSLVVALMQAQSAIPVRTFSIGFKEKGYDEAPYAKRIAEHLGCDHTEEYVAASEAMGLVPELPNLYDEPFSDSSQIPTYIVSRLARRSVTVSLSGDGGDELLAGYSRYFWATKAWRMMGPIPLVARSLVSRGIKLLSVSSWERLYNVLKPILPHTLSFHTPGDKFHKLAEVLRLGSFGELYTRLLSHWDDPASIVVDGREPPSRLTDTKDFPKNVDSLQLMMFLDMLSYLPEEILTKIDRASMAVGLEARVPLLDHRLVEFCWSLPSSLKVRNGVSKWPLRQVLYKYVPQELIERPKMGFGIPLQQWLRGGLRDWAESLLSEASLSSGGFFDPKPIRARWSEHLAGTRNWHYSLWNVLMFQAWYQSLNK